MLQEKTESTQPNPNNRKRNRNIGIGIGATAAAAALSVGAYLFVDANNGPAIDPKPTAEPSKTPEATPTASPEDNFTAEQIALPDTLTPEETGTKFTEALSKWEMAGATPENAAAWLGSSNSPQFVRDLVAEKRAIFIDTMLIPDWDTDEHQGLRDFIGSSEPGAETGWTRVIIANLTNYFQTYDSGNPIDVKPASREERVDSSELISQTEDQFTVATHVTTIIEVNNRVPEWDPEVLITNGTKSTFTQTFQTVNGFSRLSAIYATKG